MKTPAEKLAAVLDTHAAYPDDLQLGVDAAPRATGPDAFLTLGDLRAIRDELEAAARFRAEVELLVADTTTYVARINPTSQYREGRKDGAAAVLARVERLKGLARINAANTETARRIRHGDRS